MFASTDKYAVHNINYKFIYFAKEACTSLAWIMESKCHTTKKDTVNTQSFSCQNAHLGPQSKRHELPIHAESKTAIKFSGAKKINFLCMLNLK